MTGVGIAVNDLADALSGLPELGAREAVDRTGLKGRYDFTLKWTLEMASEPIFGSHEPKEGVGSGARGGSTAGMPPVPVSSDLSGPSIFTAVQQQLGLKLKPERGPVKILVIDHIEQPTPN
jgi:uncharacterized protein (TIGR03435 family)